MAKTKVAAKGRKGKKLPSDALEVARLTLEEVTVHLHTIRELATEAIGDGAGEGVVALRAVASQAGALAEHVQRVLGGSTVYGDLTAWLTSPALQQRLAALPARGGQR